MSASPLTSLFGAHHPPSYHQTSRTSSFASSQHQKPIMRSFLGKVKRKIQDASNAPNEQQQQQQQQQRRSGAPQNNYPFAPTAPATRRPKGPGINAFGRCPNEAPPPYSAGPASPNEVAILQVVAQTPEVQHESDNQYAFLADFDTVFLIDDSGSMAGHRWQQTKAALQSITPICTQYDANGIDIYFLNFRPKYLPPMVTAFNRNLDHFENITQAGEVAEIFDMAKPQAATPTGRRLNDILKPYLEDLKKGKDRKPMNIIVITDGEPSDDVEAVLINAAKTLDRIDAPPRQVGIQFFQVGNDEYAQKHLKQLDDELRKLSGDPYLRDIVDTIPFTSKNGGELTSKGILKAVLGSVHTRLDRDSQDLHRS